MIAARIPVQRAVDPGEGLRVLVPYVTGMLKPATRQAVLEQWPGAWLYTVDAADETAYTRLLLDEWQQDHTTIVVEQDVVPPPGSITELYRCSAPWCTVPYLIGDRLEDHALGFAKFRWSLKAALPWLLRVAAREHGGRGAPITWRNLDQSIASALGARGVRVHVHDDHRAEHLHDYSREDSSGA